MTDKPKRRAIPMVAVAAAPAACSDCADKDAQIAALEAELAEVRRSLDTIQRLRG